MLAASFAVAPATPAAVTLLSQDRLVRVTEDGEHFCYPETDPWCICDPQTPEYPWCLAIPPAGPYSLLDEASAPDFTPFDATATVSLATASQTSTLGTDVIEGTGSTDVNWRYDIVYGPPVDYGTIAGSTARSHLVVSFAVTDEPVPFSFQADGSLNNWQHPGQPDFVVRLTDGASTVVDFPCIDDYPGQPLFGCSLSGETQLGVLAPGTYTLEVSTETLGDPGELGGRPAIFGGSSYAFRLGFGPAASLPGLGWAGGALTAAGLTSCGWLTLLRRGAPGRRTAPEPARRGATRDRG